MISKSFGYIVACVMFIPELENTGDVFCIVHDRKESTDFYDWIES